jgi:iron complex transport system substrate-binding protein
LFYQVADALGKKHKASQVVADYRTRIAQFKARMGTRLSSTKVSVIHVRQQEIATYNKVSFGGRILAEVGLSRPLSQTLDAQTALRRSGFTFADVMSWESLSNVDADVMFVISNEIGRPHNSLDQLRTQPLWSRLKVVQQGRVYEVGYYWQGFGPISANRVLDDLEKYVLKSPHPTNQTRL